MWLHSTLTPQFSSSIRFWWSFRTDLTKTWWHWSKNPNCCDSLVRRLKPYPPRFWFYVNSGASHKYWCCVRLIQWCILGLSCRGQRSADCGPGENPQPHPAADGGVRARIRLQASAQHRDGEHRQQHPQTDCESIVSASVTPNIPDLLLTHSPSDWSNTCRKVQIALGYLPARLKYYHTFTQTENFSVSNRSFRQHPSYFLKILSHYV